MIVDLHAGVSQLYARRCDDLGFNVCSRRDYFAETPQHQERHRSRLFGAVSAIERRESYTSSVDSRR